MSPCSARQTGNSAADVVALGLRSLTHCGLSSVVMRVGDSGVFPTDQTDNTDVDILLTGSSYFPTDAHTSTSTGTDTVDVLELARACLVGTFGEADTRLIKVLPHAIILPT